MHGLDELEQKRKEAQEWLEKVGKLISQRATDNDNSIQFKSQIEESKSVAGTIIEFAENQNMDLIVVTYATCPVLVIK